MIYEDPMEILQKLLVSQVLACPAYLMLINHTFTRTIGIMWFVIVAYAWWHNFQELKEIKEGKSKPFKNN